MLEAQGQDSVCRYILFALHFIEKLDSGNIGFFFPWSQLAKLHNTHWLTIFFIKESAIFVLECS